MANVALETPGEVAQMDTVSYRQHSPSAGPSLGASGGRPHYNNDEDKKTRDAISRNGHHRLLPETTTTTTTTTPTTRDHQPLTPTAGMKPTTVTTRRTPSRAAEEVDDTGPPNQPPPPPLRQQRGGGVASVSPARRAAAAAATTTTTARWPLGALSSLWLLLCSGLVVKHRELIAVFFAFCLCWLAAGAALLLLRHCGGARRGRGDGNRRRGSRPTSPTATAQDDGAGKHRHRHDQNHQPDRHPAAHPSHRPRVRAAVGLLSGVVQWCYLLQAEDPTVACFSARTTATYTALSVAAGHLAFDHWFTAVYGVDKSLATVTEDAVTLTLLLVTLVAWTVHRERAVGPSAWLGTPSPTCATARWDPGRAAVAAWTVYKMIRFIADALRLHDRDGTRGRRNALETPTVHPKSLALTTAHIQQKHDAVAIASEPSERSLRLAPTGATQKLWSIHGVTYDLSAFVEHHPGGREAILLGRGRDDCTALFQSYHPFAISHARRVLHKYRPAAAPAAASSDAISGGGEGGSGAAAACDVSDPFYHALCERVTKVLTQEQAFHPIHDRAATPLRTVYYIAVLTAVAASGVAHCRGSVLGSVCLALSGWLVGALGHDGGHFAVSRKWPVVNDGAVWAMSLLCNPILWQHQHTFAHHSHTNEFDRDPDLHHFGTFLRVHRRFQQQSLYRHQSNPIFVFFAYAFVVFGTCIWIPWGMIQEGSLYGMVEWSDRQRPLRTAGMYIHLFGYTGFILILPFWVHSTWLAALASVTAHVATSGTIFAIFSQINHLNEGSLDRDTFKKRNSQRDAVLNNSWAVRQIETSNNFCPQSVLWHLLSNGLNLQIEHHLFPSLNHCHLHRVQPTVQAFCEEQGVCYKSYNSWRNLMRATLQWLDRLSTEPELAPE